MHIIRFQLQGFGLILDFNGQIQVLKDAVKQGQCSLNVHLNVQQLPNGEEEPALQGCECDDTSQTDCSARRVVYNLRARDEIHNRRCDRKEDANEHEEPATDHLLAYFQVVKV